jgi:hypothetical protein
MGDQEPFSSKVKLMQSATENNIVTLEVTLIHRKNEL